MRYLHALFRMVYVGGGLGMITRLPRVFGTIYRITDRRGVDRLMRLPRYGAQRLSARRLMRFIRHFSPDAAICTHFLPAELLAAWRRKGKLAAPLYVAITDFEPHRIWEHTGVDGYFVSSDLAARRLMADGVSPDSVHVTGIPISADFSRRFNRAALRLRLGVDAERPVVLVTGGGLGAGSLESIARAAMERRAEAQFVFVAGGNTRLRARLEQQVSGAGWRVLGFVSNIHEWMAAADVAIGKAGGLTGSEMLAAGLPFVVPPGVHGHEDRNAAYLERCGAARVTASIGEAVAAALSIASQPERHAQMCASARRVARPRAAHAIASIVLRDLGRPA